MQRTVASPARSRSARLLLTAERDLMMPIKGKRVLPLPAGPIATVLKDLQAFFFKGKLLMRAGMLALMQPVCRTGCGFSPCVRLGHFSQPQLVRKQVDGVHAPALGCFLGSAGHHACHPGTMSVASHPRCPPPTQLPCTREIGIAETMGRLYRPTAGETGAARLTPCRFERRRSPVIPGMTGCSCPAGS